MTGAEAADGAASGEYRGFGGGTLPLDTSSVMPGLDPGIHGFAISGRSDSDTAVEGTPVSLETNPWMAGPFETPPGGGSSSG
jgi:hypothetical protein